MRTVCIVSAEIRQWSLTLLVQSRLASEHFGPSAIIMSLSVIKHIHSTFIYTQEIIEPYLPQQHQREGNNTQITRSKQYNSIQTF